MIAAVAISTEQREIIKAQTKKDFSPIVEMTVLTRFLQNGADINSVEFCCHY
jgi:hypothetical protein